VKLLHLPISVRIPSQGLAVDLALRRLGSEPDPTGPGKAMWFMIGLRAVVDSSPRRLTDTCRDRIDLVQVPLRDRCG
jgi:hypothetical protein